MRGRTEREDFPQIDNLLDHFKTLLNKDEANSMLHEENINAESNISKTFKSVNNIIVEKAVRFTINNLKLKKSSRYDCISNEC